jgi:hypothetical protein
MLPLPLFLRIERRGRGDVWSTVHNGLPRLLVVLLLRWKGDRGRIDLVRSAIRIGVARSRELLLLLLLLWRRIRRT